MSDLQLLIIILFEGKFCFVISDLNPFFVYLFIFIYLSICCSVYLSPLLLLLLRIPLSLSHSSLFHVISHPPPAFLLSFLLSFLLLLIIIIVLLPCFFFFFSSSSSVEGSVNRPHLMTENDEVGTKIIPLSHQLCGIVSWLQEK